MTQDDLSSVNIAALRENRQWQTQYRILMEWGGKIQPKPELRLPEYKIRGCSADAWLCRQDDGFYFDSDSRIINGLAALLLVQVTQEGGRMLDVQVWRNLLQELGLQKHLSPSRNNGFQALVLRMNELWYNPPLPRGEGQ
jgi:SufE protein probably involved in Fe-S center assembly